MSRPRKPQEDLWHRSLGDQVTDEILLNLDRRARFAPTWSEATVRSRFNPMDVFSKRSALWRGLYVLLMDFMAASVSQATGC